ncbi:Fructose-6-phosphate aldolase [bioreactor metagenome]|uniref:Fructose-6-phosphate aldolase n=1 Tax=bioreactor metagenome TaxID=1076179 RepID=A0A645BDS4_9ZZZZ
MDLNLRIDEMREDIIRTTQELVRIKSLEGEPKPGMPFGEDVAKALQCALDNAEKLGLKTVNVDGYVGYAEIGEGEDYVAALGHLDIVPEGDGWIHPPYGGEIHDDKIFGRGTLDDKGPIVACLYGLKAIKELKKQGIKITATAIFTAHQGFLAAKAGADYVAPYVNRLDNISADGISVVSDLVKILNTYNMKTKVLAASFKNCQQVLELMKSGVHSVTVPADICSAMMNHPLTNWSVDKFTEDWYDAFGEDTTTKKK